MAQEDILKIRAQLGEIGRVQNTVEIDEFAVTIGTSTVYVSYQSLVDISGVWLATDIDKTGINYYTGGSFDEAFGKITLGTPVASANTEVLVTYVRRVGLLDEEIEEHFESAKAYVFSHIWDGFDLSDESEEINILARETIYALASYWCILAMNTGNVIENGFNYRLEEFEIQSKLWGEGMIAQALLATYWDKAIQMLHVLSYNVNEIAASNGSFLSYTSGYPLYNSAINKKRSFSSYYNYYRED